MRAYYNENDPGAAAWLRELISAGLIADGVVDDRSIQDVGGHDALAQAHFFAGIGGWSYALRLAGWPDDAPVWTGSCPCQPFSDAGRRGGVADERHLWPEWFRLIRERRPPVLFGEQVASKAGLGWFDLVSADLEGEGYTVAAADLCAASVGAPHIRQRLYFVAYADEAGRRVLRSARVSSEREPSRGHDADGRGKTGAVGDPSGSGPQGRVERRDGRGEQPSRSAGVGSEGFWTPTEWLLCRDGKARPVEPGTFPLVAGLPGRVGLLRGYGNAIVPQVAAAFIEAVTEVVA